ncbi:hypothetical protein [Sinomonas sp. ASV322]|uniref:hypothetical protein n=1 Tax=Sinomonas sp. ASV322 TaxID=3041920 RepID=UPI0027DCEC18|nr:hypothetical protein [Sinomonas sp. ASV322]MDQ4503933.1 hypothetical protein [Sinomonas sp. ASV322]
MPTPISPSPSTAIDDEPSGVDDPHGDHPPSSIDSESPEEVTTMIQRLRQILSTGIDAERIEAHREAVHREIALTTPLR